MVSHNTSVTDDDDDDDGRTKDFARPLLTYGRLKTLDYRYITLQIVNVAGVKTARTTGR